MAEDHWQPFEETDHTADLGLIARGRDLPELILNAARGVIHLISDPEGLAPDEWIPLEAVAPEPERLLVGFLKQLLYEWEAHGGLPVVVEMEAAPDAAWLANPREPAVVRGRLGIAHPTDLDDRTKALPKAATYHGLEIRRVGDRLEVSLVLDV